MRGVLVPTQRCLLESRWVERAVVCESTQRGIRRSCLVRLAEHDVEKDDVRRTVAHGAQHRRVLAAEQLDAAVRLVGTCISQRRGSPCSDSKEQRAEGTALPNPDTIQLVPPRRFLRWLWW